MYVRVCKCNVVALGWRSAQNRCRCSGAAAPVVDSQNHGEHGDNGNEGSTGNAGCRSRCAKASVPAAAVNFRRCVAVLVVSLWPASFSPFVMFGRPGRRLMQYRGDLVT